MIRYLKFDATRYLKDVYSGKCDLSHDLIDKINSILPEKEKDVIDTYFSGKSMTDMCDKYGVGEKRLVEIRYKGQAQIRAYIDGNISIKAVCEYYDFDIKQFLKDVANDGTFKSEYDEACKILSHLEKDIIHESYFMKTKQKQIAMEFCYSEQHINRVKKIAESKMRGFLIGKMKTLDIDYESCKEDNS